jgi:hypothetical protein
MGRIFGPATKFIVIIKCTFRVIIIIIIIILETEREANGFSSYKH